MIERGVRSQSRGRTGGADSALEVPRGGESGAPNPSCVRFDFHGTTAEVHFDEGGLAEEIRRDFSFFQVAEGESTIRLGCWLRAPPYHRAPDGRCVMVLPGCAVYEHQGQRWVDYQGRALARLSHQREEGEVWSEDAALLHEIIYLFLLSRVGEHLDRQGIHRVHALGLAVEGQAMLCLLPSGGGKTTLALRLLREPGVQLLSDDTPLLTRTGDLLAFPARIGCVSRPEGIDDAYLRRFERREHGVKWTIDLDAFAGRIAREARPAVVIVGARRLQGPAELGSCPLRRAAGEALRSVVVGLGLPQVVEYFLRFDVGDMRRKAAIVASRALAAAALLRRSRRYVLALSRDTEQNARALATLLQDLRAGG